MQENGPKTNPEEDFTQGLDYPAENEAGFDGLTSGENPDYLTPEQVEKNAKREAIERLSEIEEIFHRDGVFGIWDHENHKIKWRYKDMKTPLEIKRDVFLTRNLCHESILQEEYKLSGATQKRRDLLIKEGFGSFINNTDRLHATPYSFWYEQSGLPGSHDRELAPANLTFIFDQETTSKFKEGLVFDGDSYRSAKEDVGVIDIIYGLDQELGDLTDLSQNGVPWSTYHAEIVNQYKGREMIGVAAVIISPFYKWAIDNATKQPLIQEKYDKIKGEIISLQKMAEEERDINWKKNADKNKELYKYTYTENIIKDQERTEELEKKYNFRFKYPERENMTGMARDIGLKTERAVFDIDGNMLWPEQMSVEEVKALIEQKKYKPKSTRKATGHLKAVTKIKDIAENK